MDKITLPDGGWAQLRDPADVTERQRRPLVRLQRRVMMKAAPQLADVDFKNLTPQQTLEKLAPALSDEDMDSLEDIDDLLIATLVDSWSFEQPVSVDGLLDLAAPIRQSLIEAVRPLMGPLLGETTDEDVLDETSPTVPANDSDRP